MHVSSITTQASHSSCSTTAHARQCMHHCLSVCMFHPSPHRQATAVVQQQHMPVSVCTIVLVYACFIHHHTGKPRQLRLMPLNVCCSTTAHARQCMHHCLSVCMFHPSPHRQAKAEEAGPSSSQPAAEEGPKREPVAEKGECCQVPKSVAEKGTQSRGVYNLLLFP